jgi:hypothetical protein
MEALIAELLIRADVALSFVCRAASKQQRGEHCPCSALVTSTRSCVRRKRDNGTARSCQIPSSRGEQVGTETCKLLQDPRRTLLPAVYVFSALPYYILCKSEDRTSNAEDCSQKQFKEQNNISRKLLYKTTHSAVGAPCCHLRVPRCINIVYAHSIPSDQHLPRVAVPTAGEVG